MLLRRKLSSEKPVGEERRSDAFRTMAKTLTMFTEITKTKSQNWQCMVGRALQENWELPRTMTYSQVMQCRHDISISFCDGIFAEHIGKYLRFGVFEGAQLTGIPWVYATDRQCQLSSGCHSSRKT